MSAGGRRPDADEAALWRHVARDVTPLSRPPAPQGDAPLAPTPTDAPPEAAAPPDWDALLTDDRLDRLFAVAIDYARSSPQDTLGMAARDLDQNRGIVRRVIRRALTDAG